MRVDCYNACECPFSDLDFGDCFYFQGTLWLKIFDSDWRCPDSGLAVRLDTGHVDDIDFTEKVIKADAKVVAVNPIE